MIVLQVDLEPGFKKANGNNLPSVHNGTIVKFVSKVSSKKDAEAAQQAKGSELCIDYVQVRKLGDICEVHAITFPTVPESNESYVRVTIKVDEKREEIAEATCDQCPRKDSCKHILAFAFWLHRKNSEDIPSVHDFWGTELEALEEASEPLRIRDVAVCDDLRAEADMEYGPLPEAEGNAFLDAMLDEMEAFGIADSTLYQHCRPRVEEFEPIFVHHTLLDSSNNCVKDTRTFMQHMEDQAKQGLFDRLTEVSRSAYKMPLWLEVQYMRLRCSLIHRIASRKDTAENESILDKLFCKDREHSVEERQQLKQHKRFILKQTEKLENKTYRECGILLNESYPYICAAPDGITDDHIVEIKAPKTEEEFEKYLEGRETIAPKYMAQIQIQMYMANVTKALYCVLSPTFDTNGALHYVWVQADMEFVASLLGAAEDFWRDVVFPRLEKIYLNNV